MAPTVLYGESKSKIDSKSTKFDNKFMRERQQAESQLPEIKFPNMTEL